MHPDFVYLIEKLDEHNGKKIVRTNLTIITEDKMDWLPGFYRDHNDCNNCVIALLFQGKC